MKYDVEFKLKVVEFCEKNSLRYTANYFKVDRKRVREWRSQKEKLLEKKNGGRSSVGQETPLKCVPVESPVVQPVVTPSRLDTKPCSQEKFPFSKATVTVSDDYLDSFSHSRELFAFFHSSYAALDIEVISSGRHLTITGSWPTIATLNVFLQHLLQAMLNDSDSEEVFQSEARGNLCDLFENFFKELKQRKQQNDSPKKTNNGNMSTSKEQRGGFVQNEERVCKQEFELQDNESQCPTSDVSEILDYSKSQCPTSEVSEVLDYSKSRCPTSDVSKSLDCSASQCPTSDVSKILDYSKSQCSTSDVSKILDYSTSQHPSSDVSKILDYSASQRPSSDVSKILDYSKSQCPTSDVPESLDHEMAMEGQEANENETNGQMNKGKESIKNPISENECQGRHESKMPLSCDICGKNFKDKRNLLSHKKTHQDGFIKAEFPCQFCPKTFSTKYVLANHVKCEHLGIKSFLCHMCGKSFSHKHTYLEHANIHLGVKPYICEICAKRFSYERSLREHKFTHAEEKVFKCTTCSKAFQKASGLAIHRKIHNTSKDYICSVCSRGFCQRQALIRHERIHYGRKPYECSLCSKFYSDTSVLRRHMLLIHKKKASCWKEDTVTHSQNSSGATVQVVKVRQQGDGKLKIKIQKGKSGRALGNKSRHRKNLTPETSDSTNDEIKVSQVKKLSKSKKSSLSGASFWNTPILGQDLPHPTQSIYLTKDNDNNNDCNSDNVNDCNNDNNDNNDSNSDNVNDCNNDNNNDSNSDNVNDNDRNNDSNNDNDSSDVLPSVSSPFQTSYQTFCNF